jgi:superfamily I DNA and/or RNA helicase
MAKKRKDCFPMIREENELLAEIRESETLHRMFQEWPEEKQRIFLDCCTGARGVKMLYDSFFKEIMNPEKNPERIEELLSLLLDRQVRILKVLPLEGTRLAGAHSLVIMDIVVELEGGSLANVEVQKLGYRFPGQRSACYSADLLLRQYKRVREEKRERFHYRDIKTVYTVVLFEQSPDTGLELDLLQEFCFVPLDIFQQIYHNKGIRDRRDAWLVFLSMEEPEGILDLLECCPDFGKLYEEIYRLCRNVEDIMEMFSRELQELDRNTVQYMMDEMQEEIDQQKEEISQQKEKLDQKDRELEELRKRIQELESGRNGK